MTFTSNNIQHKKGNYNYNQQAYMMLGRNSVADPLRMSHSLQYSQHYASYNQYPMKMDSFDDEPGTSFQQVQNVEVTPDIDQFYGIKDENIKRETLENISPSENGIPTISVDLDSFSRINDGDSSLICKRCNHSFKNYRTLALHFSKYHPEYEMKTDDETLKCKACNIICLSESELKSHKCVKKHLCEYCNKSFSNSAYFGLHLKMHTEGSNHCCDICNKCFVNSSNYKIHLRIHDGDRPFKCVECDKGFLTSTNLSTHMRIHTGQRPFKCEHCSKTFINSSNLNIHRKYHEGLKSYQCKICSKAFLTSSNLKVHIRIHTGEKPYRCFMCEKAFVTSSNLNLHIKSHKGTVNFDAGQT